MDIAVLDKVLEELNDRYPSALFVDEFVVRNLNITDPKKYIKYSTFLLDKGFVKPTDFADNSRVRITELGQYVVELGGYKKYLESLENEKDHIQEIKRLEEENIKLQNRQLKRSVLFSVIGFIAGSIVTFSVAVLPFIMSDRKEVKQEHATEKTPKHKSDNQTKDINPIDTLETP